MDLGGTSVSEMDVDLLERLLTGGVRDVGGGEKEDVGTLSPLTATQKTHNTTQFTHTQQCHGVDAKEIEAATEALMLVRWIGKQGINVIMRQNKVARVLFGIMLPKDDGNDELLEQYVVRSTLFFYLYLVTVSFLFKAVPFTAFIVTQFQFGCNAPTQPSQNLALTQARHAMSSFFQNLNGYSAGNSRLSQAVVPMMTQGTVGTYTQASGSAANCHFEDFPTQQTEYTEVDDKSAKSRYSNKHSRRTSSVATMSQKSIVESMTQSIKASVKRNKGARIPSERYLTLRIEFTESLSSSDLPAVLRSNGTSISLQSQTNGMVVTPLGTVAEENCTGLSVEMTAYSKAEAKKYSETNDGSAMQRERQFMIDELLVDEENFEPFTQMDGEKYEDDASKSSEVGNDNSVNSTTSRNKSASTKRKTVEDPSPKKKKSRCVSPLESSHLSPGTKALAIPSFGNNGSQTYLKCTIRDHRISPEQYKVEFVSNALEKKKQWVPARKVVKASVMLKRIESALVHTECDDEEELIELVAEKLAVKASLVGSVLSKIS